MTAPQTNMSRILRSTAFVVIVSFSLASCAGTIAKKAVERETGVQVKEGKDGAVEMKTKDGSFSSGNKVPDGFPKDVPLPKGKIASSMSAKMEGKKTWLVTTEVSDLKAAVYELKSKLEANGYAIENDFSSSENGTDTSISTAKKGTSTVTILGEKKPDSAATLSVSVAQPA
jgi:hypothetical protein